MSETLCGVPVALLCFVALFPWARICPRAPEKQSTPQRSSTGWLLYGKPLVKKLAANHGEEKPLAFYLPQPQPAIGPLSWRGVTRIPSFLPFFFILDSFLDAMRRKEMAGILIAAEQENRTTVRDYDAFLTSLFDFRESDRREIVGGPEG